jgi:predicted fused transcriptional regulator/phosphomethylpyrimidine kinase
MSKSAGEAICEEFCDKVVVGSHVSTHPTRLFRSVEDFKCVLNIEHFTPLVERMVGAGYCCTQVQKDQELKKCTAWFESMTEEELF